MKQEKQPFPIVVRTKLATVRGLLMQQNPHSYLPILLFNSLMANEQLPQDHLKSRPSDKIHLYILTNREAQALFKGVEIAAYLNRLFNHMLKMLCLASELVLQIKERCYIQTETADAPNIVSLHNKIQRTPESFARK